MSDDRYFFVRRQPDEGDSDHWKFWRDTYDRAQNFSQSMITPGQTSEQTSSASIKESTKTRLGELTPPPGPGVKSHSGRPRGLIERYIDKHRNRIGMILFIAVALGFGIPGAIDVVKPVSRQASPAAGVDSPEKSIGEQLREAGWRYTPPQPKSPQASWHNSDGRTTWWYGYWHNKKSGRFSSTQPTHESGFRGDGINRKGNWRRGGRPNRRPNSVEQFCMD